MPWKNYSDKVFSNNNFDENRFEIVKDFLAFFDKYKESEIVDKSFLKYNLTELIESGKVYISEAALKEFDQARITQLCGNDLSNFPTKPHQLRYTQYLRAEKPEGQKFTWEHVVPVGVLLDLIKENKSLTQEKFSEISQMAHVCIVTNEENNKLNKYQDKMPDGWDKDNPWARYDELDIEVHGRQPSPMKKS